MSKRKNEPVELLRKCFAKSEILDYLSCVENQGEATSVPFLSVVSATLIILN